jgi:hypothetical protein
MILLLVWILRESYYEPKWNVKKKESCGEIQKRGEWQKKNLSRSADEAVY